MYDPQAVSWTLSLILDPLPESCPPARKRRLSTSALHKCGAVVAISLHQRERRDPEQDYSTDFCADQTAPDISRGKHMIESCTDIFFCYMYQSINHCPPACERRARSLACAACISAIMPMPPPGGPGLDMRPPLPPAALVPLALTAAAAEPVLATLLRSFVVVFFNLCLP